MRIGIDIMGGDFAPQSAIAGSYLAIKEMPEDVKLVFFGDREVILAYCEKNDLDSSCVEIFHASEVIGMPDNPYKSFFSKNNSSMHQGFRLLREGEIDAFCSAGNTGAMMVGVTQVINAIPGIIRPAIAVEIPNLKGRHTVMLDVGINPDSRPDVLYQYGILGKAFAQSLNGISDPEVGLINIGKEEEKGNLTSKSAYQLMNESTEFNFIGNIEGHEILTDPRAEVLVCDGFVGNIILKQTESFYQVVKSRQISDPYFEIFNFENFGGTPILGINKPVVVGHGISGEKAIKSMILQTWNVTRNNLINYIKEAVE